MRKFKSYGDGKSIQLILDQNPSIVIEDGCRFFHPENLRLGCNIYFGHDCYIQAYHRGQLTIKDNVWIGPKCYIHAAGNIIIGKNVGIGAHCKLITSSHDLSLQQQNILDAPLIFKPIVIEDGVDIGVGSVILPGVTLENGVQIGANSVVSKSIPANSIAVGSPAKVIRQRNDL